ncbi:MAG TPA: hypothetical protein VFL59_01870 [Candidatus Nanopelagicales bacterium]|nr:hypothetical protein [Candidatus Nanopelagicales bacterium]
MAERPRALLLRAAVLVALCIAIGQASTYLLNLVAARALGPASFGELASLLGILAIGNVVALGVQAATARRIVTSPPSDHRGTAAAALRASFPAGLAVAAATALTYPITSSLLHLGGPADLLLVAVSLIPLTVVGAQLGVAQGSEAPGRLALVYLGGAVKSAGGIAGAVLGGTVTSTLVGVAIGSVAMAVALQLVVHPLADAAPLHQERWASEVLHASHALAALFVLTTADLLLARHFLPAVQSGVYAAGSIVAKIAFWLPQAVIVLAFPGMADHRRRRALVVGGVGVAALGAALVLATELLPDLVVLVVGGAAYSELASFVWMFALLGALQSLAQFLLYSRLAVEDRRAVGALWAAVVAVVALVWVGPHSTPVDIVRSAVVVTALLCVAGGALAVAEIRRDVPEDAAVETA